MSLTALNMLPLNPPSIVCFFLGGGGGVIICKVNPCEKKKKNMPEHNVGPKAVTEDWPLNLH